MGTLTETTHPEDIKAALRKRYGSIKAFEQAEGLPKTGVSDFFRGRVSQRVTDAIETVLQRQCSESNEMDSSSDRASVQRLCGAGIKTTTSALAGTAK